MDVIISEVEGILQDNGGAMAYPELHDRVSFQSRLQLYPALRVAKHAGRLVLRNPVDPQSGRATFFVSLAGRGGE